MSATILREAAESMRANWEGEDCEPAEAEFYLAVADWLDEDADDWTDPDDDGIAFYRAYRVATIYLGVTP